VAGKNHRGATGLLRAFAGMLRSAADQLDPRPHFDIIAALRRLLDHHEPTAADACISPLDCPVCAWPWSGLPYLSSRTWLSQGSRGCAFHGGSAGVSS